MERGLWHRLRAGHPGHSHPELRCAERLDQPHDQQDHQCPGHEHEARREQPLAAVHYHAGQRREHRYARTNPVSTVERTDATRLPPRTKNARTPIRPPITIVTMPTTSNCVAKRQSLCLELPHLFAELLDLRLLARRRVGQHPLDHGLRERRHEESEQYAQRPSTHISTLARRAALRGSGPGRPPGA